MRRCVALAIAIFAFVSPTAEARSAWTFSRLADASVRRYPLATHARDLTVIWIKVDGHEIYLADGGNTAAADMYGRGVVVRFTQRGSDHFVTIVSAAGRSRVTFRYH